MTAYMKFLPFITALVSAALFGLATPVSKSLLAGINPFHLAGLLYLGAALGLLIVSIIRKTGIRIQNLNRVNTFRLLGTIVMGGILGPVFLLFGLRLASATTVSLWLNLELIATVILGRLFYKEHLGGIGLFGVCLALVSGLLLTINEGRSGLSSAILVGLACVCWGWDNHFTALIDRLTAVQSTFWKGIVAGTVNVVIGFQFADMIGSLSIIGLALLVGCFAYGVSIVLYIISAQKIGAIRSQIVFSSAPFFGVIFSLLLLGEPLSYIKGISFGILLVSITMLALEKHSHSHIHLEEEHIHLHRHDDSHHIHHNYIVQGMHEHPHKHVAQTHTHPHMPDLHHRHQHTNSQ